MDTSKGATGSQVQVEVDMLGHWALWRFDYFYSNCFRLEVDWREARFSLICHTILGRRQADIKKQTFKKGNNAFRNVQKSSETIISELLWSLLNMWQILKISEDFLLYKIVYFNFTVQCASTSSVVLPVRTEEQKRLDKVIDDKQRDDINRKKRDLTELRESVESVKVVDGYGIYKEVEPEAGQAASPKKQASHSDCHDSITAVSHLRRQA